MSQPTAQETNVAHCPKCSREIPDMEMPVKCSHLGCTAVEYECCRDFETCEYCDALLCEVHRLQYQHYVLCAKCHVIDSKRRMLLGVTVGEKVVDMVRDSLEPKDYAEQDGRRWRGYIDCETILERIMLAIQNGTLAPEVDRV